VSDKKALVTSLWKNPRCHRGVALAVTGILLFFLGGGDLLEDPADEFALWTIYVGGLLFLAGVARALRKDSRISRGYPRIASKARAPVLLFTMNFCSRIRSRFGSNGHGARVTVGAATASSWQECCCLAWVTSIFCRDRSQWDQTTFRSRLNIRGGAYRDRVHARMTTVAKGETCDRCRKCCEG
jgi:hypothetical protein